MADTLPVSPPQSSPVVPEQPQVTPLPPAPAMAKVSDTLGSAEYAGFGARFLAMLVDGIIVAAIYFVLMIPGLIMGAMTAAGGGSELPTATLGLQLLFQLAVL